MGHVQYFHTKEPKSFNASHARNIAIHVARGQRFCNLDVDNFLDYHFLKFILDLPETQFATPYRDKVAKGAAGRLCAHKQVLQDINGYDEEMLRLQDADMRARLSKTGLIEVNIPHSEKLKVIDHNDEARSQCFSQGKTLEQLKQEAIQRMRILRGQLPRNLKGWGIARGQLNFIPYTTP